MGFFRKALVLATAFLAILLLVGAGLYHALRLPEPVSIETVGQPSLGNSKASVKVVVFADFLCRECRLFHETVFRQIEAAYIATQKIEYTFIPLGFLDYSKPIANAALAVHHLAPDRFFAFVDAIFHRFSPEKVDGSEQMTLLAIAKEVGGIDSKQLKTAIETHRYDKELDRNFASATHLMGAELGTPALYVNGIPTSTSNFRAIERMIDRAIYLGQK